MANQFAPVFTTLISIDISIIRSLILTENQKLIPTIYAGWHACQNVMTKAIGQLDPDQLKLRASPELRSVGKIAAHVIGARARWLYLLMGEGGNEFKAFGKWDH